MKTVRNIYLLLMVISLILKIGIALENVKRLSRQYKNVKDYDNEDTEHNNSARF